MAKHGSTQARILPGELVSRGNHKAKRINWECCGLLKLRSHPNDILLARPHPLLLPKQFHQPGSEYLNELIGGLFSSNAPRLVRSEGGPWFSLDIFMD